MTIDLDVTEDQTHGAQQLTFFNGFYDHWCYLPLVATLTFDDEARQYLVAAILRPGNAAGTAGAVSLLQRLLPKLRRAFPGARLRTCQKRDRWLAGRLIVRENALFTLAAGHSLALKAAGKASHCDVSLASLSSKAMAPEATYSSAARPTVFRSAGSLSWLYEWAAGARACGWQLARSRPMPA